MTTFTAIVASVVAHSSAAALSHFGVTLEPTQSERQAAPMEHVVARSPAQVHHRVMKLSNCPARQADAQATRI